MPHHIYTTEAFVLESVAVGESDRFYTLFTKELGLVRASGRGVRLEKSKLRPNLQDFSRINLSIVRGKEVWRITNAKVEESLHVRYALRKDILSVIAHLFILIKRLVTGEEKNEKLFLVLNDIVRFLDLTDIDPSFSAAFELIAVLKVLDNLGYAGENPQLAKFFRNDWSIEKLSEMNNLKHLAVKEINSSLKETQL